MLRKTLIVLLVLAACVGVGTAAFWRGQQLQRITDQGVTELSAGKSWQFPAHFGSYAWSEGVILCPYATNIPAAFAATAAELGASYNDKWQYVVLNTPTRQPLSRVALSKLDFCDGSTAAISFSPDTVFEQVNTNANGVPVIATKNN